MVTELGRYKFSGNGKMHTLIIQRCDPAPLDENGILTEVVASAQVDLSDPSCSVGMYEFTKLEQPIILEPNTPYYFASYEDTTAPGGDSYATTGTDAFNTDLLVFNPNTSVPSHFGGCVVDSAVYKATVGGSWVSDTTVGTLKSLVNLRIK